MMCVLGLVALLVGFVCFVVGLAYLDAISRPNPPPWDELEDPWE